MNPRSRTSALLPVALALAACALAAGCKKSAAPAVQHPTAAESALRAKLGIPPDAKQVILFGQNAHLDIDWQRTFDAYYQDFVEDIFTQASQLLRSQPRAYYSIAEMAYLQHHLQAHPEQVAAFQSASARGALHIVGGGMTSPDTLLPEPELLFRDSLYGIQFAEDWLGQTPRSAWLPDSFGHSATAPDILAAAGYTSVAFSRIDGAPSLFEEIGAAVDPSLGQMKPGSNALLLQQLGSADFTWRGAGGATVLAHFMPGFGLYCEGDNLDYQEDIEVAGGHTGPFMGDDSSFTDARVDGYAAELSAYARTPYLFVPVGCDFQSPKQALISYLDGYNQRRYPTTHIWAAAVPFDDYAELVSNWSAELPELSGELSPYYMGFYGSRADIKRGARDAAAPFFTAETFAAALGAEGRDLTLAAAPALQLLTRADHHDFVTGTAADPVVASEQTPLLSQSLAAGNLQLDAVARALASRIPATPGAASRLLALNASSATRDEIAEVQLPLVNGQAPAVRPQVNGVEVPCEVSSISTSDNTATLRLALANVLPFSWRTIDLMPGAPAAPAPAVSLVLSDSSNHPVSAAQATRAVLSNARVRAQLDNDGTGFALTSVVIDGAEALAGRSLLVHDAHDQGGLWRLGNEMSGCALTDLPDPAGAPLVQVLEQTPLMVHISFQSPTETREAWLGAGQSGLSLAITTGADVPVTRTVSFALSSGSAPLVTSSPAGSLVRPPEQVYSPTYYPAVSWVCSVTGRPTLFLSSLTKV